MKLFDSPLYDSPLDMPAEKGSREWKLIGDILRDSQTSAYKIKKPNVVRVRVKPGAQHHQQIFILKHAR